MSVLSEKNAVKAAFVTVLTNTFAALSITLPSGDTPAQHVFWGVLPEPNTKWPALVGINAHYVATEIPNVGGGAQKGNPDEDPNLYHWEYHDQLISQTGSTVEATMDAHDVFLDALIQYTMSQTNHYLPDGSNHRQVESFGETVTRENVIGGPYDLRSGSAVLLSEGTIDAKQLHRDPTA